MKNFGVFPAPKNVEYRGGEVSLDGKVCADGAAQAYLSAFVHALFHPAFSEGKGNLRLVTDGTLGDEEYRIEAAGDGCTAYASGRRGFLYAASALSQLIGEDGSMPALSLTDAPYMSLRGIHTYLPPVDCIGEFCRILDLLAHLRYNTLFLEIGGGVEYDSHPEVNDAWRTFCRQAKDYPGGPQGLQASEAHWKDSTHVELAGGSVLTKRQLMVIVNYARALGMEVIPEIQALSHSYYLTLAHREIAEQPFEPWPDTYCPMNPASYDLYFDLARELHDLIGFSKVSIGHDEIRILGKCPRCRGKSGAELVAHDLNTLHDFYASLGVEVYMWGESLQHFINKDGKRFGDGADYDSPFGRHFTLPKTHGAIDRIPRDMVMLDWAWGGSRNTEGEFTERGIRQIYGNFNGQTMLAFDERSKKSNVIGAEVSTWCVANEDENGRNGWFTVETFTSAVLWQDDFNDGKRDALQTATDEKMADVRAIVRGLPLPRAKTERKYCPVTPIGTEAMSDEPTPDYMKDTARALIGSGTVGYGTTHENSVIEIGSYADTLTFLHGTDFGVGAPFAREFTWFFHDKTPRILAMYAITYEDGITFSVPVEYGVQVGNLGADVGYLRGVENVSVEDEEKHKNENTESEAYDRRPVTIGRADQWMNACEYFTDVCPVLREGAAGTVYAWEYKNPRPDKKIVRVTAYAKDKDRPDVRIYGCFVS